jgi:hypothetical protein
MQVETMVIGTVGAEHRGLDAQRRGLGKTLALANIAR